MNKVSVYLITVFAFFISSLPCLSELNILFDEDAKNEAGEGNFVGKFVSHDAGSTVTVTSKSVFSGKASVFVTPAQSYNNQMPNWSFRITDKPSGKNEYRYIRFAWKSDGGTGIMVQFPDNGAWGAVTVPCADPPAPGTRRYIAGQNVTGWTGICVAKNIPKDWTVIERDLFADFGSFTMTGLALTPFSDGGNGDYYDAIMLAAKENELPSLQAVSPKDKLVTLWAKIKNYSK
jgi:hypothetical protein